ncbi:MAG TPA: DEAD/DEAH box helicase family protein [Ramlibacter sp.]|jgi:DNA repair protein RadD
MLSLRPYQRESLNSLYHYWSNGGGNGLLVLPTGAGKSLVLASLVKELLEQFPMFRIAVVTHSRELIVQNFGEILRIWPAAPAGIYSAGVGRRDARAKVLFCGVQSVFAKTDVVGPFDLLIVDEAHLIPRNAATMYGRFIRDLLAMTPDMRIVGLTATPYRLDSGRLDEGEGSMFDDIVYEAPVTDLIDQGYLSPLISRAGASQIDTSQVHTRAGDFIQSELETAAMKVVKEAVAELVSFGQDRRAWLAFCSGVAHSEAVAAEIRSHGIEAQSVDGSMDKGTRDGLISRFRNGSIRCLTSVNVLSIGFNVPHVDLVALMRPTKSTGLYVQQVGRGFRTAPGKENALILDYAGVVRRHGPVDAVIGENAGGGKGKKSDGEAEIRAKECPECQTLAALNQRECKVCGHEWKVEEKPKHDAHADDATPVLSTERVAPKMLPVVEWDFRRWAKAGSPDSVRVTFYAGVQSFHEWLAFELPGRGRERACSWWAQHGGATPFPKTIDEALDRKAELSMPATISVKPAGKFFEITHRQFAQREKAVA